MWFGAPLRQSEFSESDDGFGRGLIRQVMCNPTDLGRPASIEELGLSQAGPSPVFRLIQIYPKDSLTIVEYDDSGSDKKRYDDIAREYRGRLRKVIFGSELCIQRYQLSKFITAGFELAG